jgi:hypothetical protein
MGFAFRVSAMSASQPGNFAALDLTSGRTETRQTQFAGKHERNMLIRLRDNSVPRYRRSLRPADLTRRKYCLIPIPL